MCGINGVVVSRGARVLPELLKKMNDAIDYRGPDSQGLWVSAEGNIGLAHRRLSIHDLSEAGHQPMISPCGRFHIVYNGEIYNFLDLKKELEQLGHTFKGHSDTEIILHAMAEWGLENALQKFVGMFAFGLYDREQEKIYLVRDRLGVKPLYYAASSGQLIFSSELKPIALYNRSLKRISKTALAQYMRYGYVPTPLSIFEGVAKLRPGHFLVYDVRDSEHQTVSYWDLKSVVEENKGRRPFMGSREEATAILDKLLNDAVNIRMLSDVPVGAFLSGGIDSSLVVAIMQRQSRAPVKTFTIGFQEQQFNEAEYAKKIAEFLKTDHHELYVSERDALDIIPLINQGYTEPFADSSQIPTYLVSRLARKSVTVVLSGDGGDEFFGGYNRYLATSSLKGLQRLPSALRSVLSKGILSISPSQWDGLFHMLQKVSSMEGLPHLPGQKMHKYASIMAENNFLKRYRILVSQYSNPESLIAECEHERFDPLIEFPDVVLSEAEKMMYLDTKTYLLDDILTKVDRATMSLSLEGRGPLLDHRVLEFAWSLPESFKIQNGQGKGILRNLLASYVPREYFERPKMGFGIPIDAWLKGALRPLIEQYLSKAAIQKHGMLNAGNVQKLVQGYMNGNCHRPEIIWNLFIFQLWFENISHW